MAGISKYLHRDALASCYCWSRCRTESLSCLLMLGSEGNQLPRLSLGILCLQVLLQSLLGPVALGEGALEAGDEAAQQPLLEVATFRMQGCFLQLLLLLQPQEKSLELCLLAARLDTSCFSFFRFRMSPMTSLFSWVPYSSSLASWSSSREIFPWRMCVISSPSREGQHVACSSVAPVTVPGQLLFDCALQQITQRGCGVSLIRDIQEPSGCDPVTSALG